ncbi:peptidase C45 [Exilibacterium tricleocarpae]|uniref:Peptidase C45 n=1 Tax=Exilibacterium tricleocarpae TaxID=2591008 RepID=A0A545SSS0_9GAMM|nr:C45 family peptidase [Exilibacterium tricleocarpae]TQV68020.1 peptidase C45 [Exilibacterium tricleocarpae]
MSLPVIDLNGDNYEQGFQHGTLLQDQIAHNIEIYLSRFFRQFGLSKDELLDHCRRYLTAIKGKSPEYEEGLRGLSEGARQPLDYISVLNLRYELFYFQFGVRGAIEMEAQPDGCTLFAVLPNGMQNGHLTIGQNWDWIPQVKGAITRIQENSGLEILSFTEAGVLGGKIGLNSAGIGLGINGMTSVHDDWTRFKLPLHYRCFNILRSIDFDSAVSIITNEPRSCSSNFLVAASPDHVVNLEAAPDIVVRLTCNNNCITHANNFRDPESSGIVISESPNTPRSERRAVRLETLINEGGIVTHEKLKTYLRDHDNSPYSICRHENMQLEEQERTLTVTSIIMDLEDRVLWATDGPPCQNSFQEIHLNK